MVLCQRFGSRVGDILVGYLTACRQRVDLGRLNYFGDTVWIEGMCRGALHVDWYARCRQGGISELRGEQTFIDQRERS